jgi:hypothetical protein
MDFSKFPKVEGISTMTQNALIGEGLTLLEFCDLMSEGYYSQGHRRIKRMPSIGKKGFKSLCDFYEKHKYEIAIQYKYEMQSFDNEDFLGNVLDSTREQFISETAGVFREMKYQYRAMIEAEIRNLIREKIKKIGVEDAVVAVVEEAVRRMAKSVQLDA